MHLVAEQGSRVVGGQGRAEHISGEAVSMCKAPPTCSGSSRKALAGVANLSTDGRRRQGGQQANQNHTCCL